MFPRKLGKLLLGKSTPFHLIASCVLGAWIGFAPSFGQAPALWVVLVATICLLPVNVFLATLTGLVAYPVSLAVMPGSFYLGRALLDGPTGGLFAALINAPFTALMGFEYYAWTGGLFVGGAFGGACGLGMSRLVRKIRRKFRDLDTNSPKFNAWASKGWVKLGCLVLLGATPKTATYEMLEGKRVGKPVRPAGVAAAVLLIAGFFGAAYFLSGPILTRSLQGGLERVNGATVDLANAEIRLDELSVVIDGLAMADPNALETDLLRGLRLEANVGVADLLQRRFRIEKLVISQAASGAQRETPGRLTGTEPTPEDVPAEGEKTLDDYLEDAKQWRERLAQVRRWLDRLAGPGDPEEDAEGLRERLETWVRERGYATATAEHLIEGAPRFSIGELRIEGLKAMQVGGKQFDVVGENLSTHPRLLDAIPRLSVRAQDESVVFDLSLAGAAKAGGANALEFSYKDLPADAIGGRLKVAGTKPLQGGTIDFSTKGTWRRGSVDLPFTVVLKGTTLALPGAGKAEKIDRLELPLRVSGPLDDPRVLFRDEDLKKALVGAGKRELAKRLEAELPDDVKEKASGILDRLKKK